MTGTEIFKRSTGYEREAETIRLHAPQWKLLLAFDGQRSLAEVALSVEVPFVEALPLTEKFLDHGWLEEQPITLDQYLKRTGAASSAAIGSAVTPAVVLHEAKTDAPSSPATPAMPAAPTPTMATIPTPPAPAPSVPPPPAAKASVPPAPAVRAAAPPLPPRPAAPPPLKTASPITAAVVPPPAAPLPPPVVRSRGPMRLKAVVDYIVSQVGNSSLGQLVVYRIFLRVPPQLLQAEDIASVHLLNDQSVVKTEALKQAIAASVMEVLKRSLPESVFANA